MPTFERLRVKSPMVPAINSYPSLKRDRPPESRWAVFVGTMVTLVFLREALTRLARHPAIAVAKGVSVSVSSTKRCSVSRC
jgi:hypothetical protein